MTPTIPPDLPPNVTKIDYHNSCAATAAKATPLEPLEWSRCKVCGLMCANTVLDGRSRCNFCNKESGLDAGAGAGKSPA